MFSLGTRETGLLTLFSHVPTWAALSTSINHPTHVAHPDLSKSNPGVERHGTARASAPSVSSLLTYQQAPTVGACICHCVEFQLRPHLFCIQSSEEPMVRGRDGFVRPYLESYLPMSGGHLLDWGYIRVVSDVIVWLLGDGLGK